MEKKRPDAEAILSAARRIEPYVLRTPVLTSAAIDKSVGGSVFFKCENLQSIGAFKVRGATNAVLSCTDAELRYGVATHSSGNHAQAVARAAKSAGVPAYIVMPASTQKIKQKGVLFYDGKIVECDTSIESREKTLAKVAHDTGAHIVHPYNDYDVIAGQATAAKELTDEVKKLDYVLVPVGGGGLLGGTLLSVHYFSPHTKVFGGEPQGADDAYRSLKSGKIEQSQGETIADGLRSNLGDKTFPIIREYATSIITVSDTEIVSAMRTMWEELRLIVEPSGAVPFAALLKKKELFAHARTGIIISGGNVDLERAMALFRGQI
ncbi:MAG TPA: pyridoxal-phosphate dependent enzyme [Cyclobacteriaceae bacterium]|nr:pyridoxal-phosphate dependent enzyme [Cyclobacteriaceae bacterium]